MKIKTVFLLVFAILLFLSCSGQKIEVFGSNFGTLGVVKNKLLNFYVFGDDWVLLPERNFSLPNKNKIVYFDRGSVIVDKTGEIKFNGFINNNWTENDAGIVLPKGYKNIFYNRNRNDIYAIYGNTFEVFEFQHSTWVERIPDFPLPKKYDDIFLYSWYGNYYLGIVENKEIKFNGIDTHNSPGEIPVFSIEGKYKKIIPYNDFIGVVGDQIIKFYFLYFDGIEGKWLEMPQMSFLIK